MWRWCEWWRDATEGEDGPYNSATVCLGGRAATLTFRPYSVRESLGITVPAQTSLRSLPRLTSSLRRLRLTVVSKLRRLQDPSGGSLTIRTILSLDTAIISDGAGIRGQAGSELKAQMMQAVRHMVTLCDVVASGQTDASDSL